MMADEVLAYVSKRWEHRFTGTDIETAVSSPSKRSWGELMRFVGDP
jgi:hypothetical protein